MVPKRATAPSGRGSPNKSFRTEICFAAGFGSAGGGSPSAVFRGACMKPPATLQTALHRGRGPSQPSRRFLLRQVLQIAKDKWLTEPLRQRGQLGVQNRSYLAPAEFVGRMERRGNDSSGLDLLPSRRCRLSLVCHAVSDAMQPTPQCVSLANRAGFACQNKESGLKRIFSVVDVVQHPAADAEDHRAMPLHQLRESRLVMSFHIALEKIAVG